MYKKDFDLKNKKLIIFGTASTAEFMNYYFENDSDYETVAFCANDEYVKEDNFLGLPLLPFSEIKNKFSPKEHSFFAAVGQMELGGIRKDAYLKAKALGYSLASYINPKANIAKNVKIGEHCFIDNVSILPYSEIGNNCIIHSGLSHHVKIKDHCLLAGHISFSGVVTVGEQTFIGSNSTIRDHITIGERCIIGAGSIVLHNIASDKVVVPTESKVQKISSSDFQNLL